MVKKNLILVFFLIVILAAGCTGLPGDDGKTIPDPPLPTAQPTQAPPVPTDPPIIILATPKTEFTVESTTTTAFTSTAIPTQEPQATIIVITNTVVSAPTRPASGQTLQIFLVAIGDNGASGKKFGCDDSLVAVDVVVNPTVAVLRTSLNELLAIKSDYYGQSGLYNALYQSDLEIEELGLENGRASIYLKGDLILGGTCDNPRVEEQLRATALQFSTVSEVEIFINGKPLGEVLSGR